MNYKQKAVNPTKPALCKSPRLDTLNAQNYIISDKEEPMMERKRDMDALCSFNDLAKMSKIVFYSTKSGAGELHYLSILVCSQPHLSDNSEYDEYLKATIHPFVTVIVTTKPMFDSALGGQMLRLMY